MTTHIDKIALTIYVTPSGIVTITQRDAMILIPAQHVREVANAIAKCVRQLVPDNDFAQEK